MKTLDEIAIEHGTDKATTHPINAHGYAPVYERNLAALRELPIKILEIGVDKGESIKMWLDYFPNAQIVGIDILENTNPWTTRNSGVHERYRFACGSQESEVFLRSFLDEFGRDWNLIVDDGGHMNNQIAISFNELWPAVIPGGIYCIEDLGVDIPGWVYHKPDWPTHHAFLAVLLSGMDAADSDIEEMIYTRELAIFRKKKIT